MYSIPKGHMTIDEKYIRRCFELAQLGLGQTKTNPIVGSVIVHNGKIIGEGYHEKYGEGHAEVNAVRSVEPQNLPLLKESTIYVSLEPCFHFGKTPPCVDLILKHQIPRVVISLTDPFPEVAGKSIEKLRQSGVEVEVGVLKEQGAFITRRFLTHVKHQRPYIILKYAQSKDGFMGKKDEQVWFTNAFSKRLVHKWRMEESAILIGKNTALIDNPQLTNRLYFGKSPIRVVIDRKTSLSSELKIFNGDRSTIVICEKLPVNQINGVEYLELNFEDDFLKNLLSHLYKKKISSLIVEGGATTLQYFITKELWDEARVFTGLKWLGSGILAPKLPFTPKNVKQIGSDELAFYYRT